MTASQNDKAKPTETPGGRASAEPATPPGEDVIETVRRIRAQQEAISASGRSDAFVAGDVDQLAREITELAAKAVGVERASVWLFNGEERQLRCVDLYEATPGRHSAGAGVSEAQQRTEFVALKKASFVDADDPLTDPRTSGYVENYLLPLRITSLLDAVIEVSGHRLGLFCLEHVLKPHHWERDEVDFACQFADGIALSLVNRARRDAQNTLRASEVRYRRLFESAMDGILIVDAETAVIVDVNPFLAALLGYAREEILGQRVWELGFLKDVLANEANFRELVENGYIRYDDRALQARNGRRIDVEFVGNVYRVNQERVVQCNIRDISEQRRIGAALRASEQKYHGLFEATRDAIMTLGPPDWTFSSANPAAVKMFGAKDVAEFVSLKPWETSPERQPGGDLSSSKAMEMIRKAMDEGSCSFEWMHQRIGGAEFAADVLLTRVQHGGSPILHATVRDITERKRVEEEVEVSLREKKALLREVHHRVKNNLQVITSLLRLEAGRSGSEDTRLVLKDMQGRIMSMALLHETLYRTGDFGRVELATYLRQLSQQLFRAHSFSGSQTRLELDLAPIQADIDQAVPCGLIVNEMLTNSLKHGFAEGQDGAVRVVLRSEADDHVYLGVSDSGVGLPADFEARRGRSLGMQLIADLARQLGGRLHTGPGPGAHFSVVFSRVKHPTGQTLRPGTTPN